MKGLDSRRRELKQTIERLRTSRSEMIDKYSRARAQYVWPLPGDRGNKNSEEDAIAAAVLAETKILSLRNLGEIEIGWVDHFFF